jgi:acetyl-CoA synthetase
VLVLKRNGQTRPGDGDFNSAMDAQRPEFQPVMRRGDDHFGVIFTSGTTGKAKGVAYPLSALRQFAVFMRDGVDLQPDDIYWCFADPGWALGIIGTLTAPLLLGHSTVLYEGPFSVESTVRVASELGVTNMVAAPTVFRMMRAAGEAAVAPLRGKLRAVVSGGEPLNPELNRWAEAALGCPIHEAYGQTEMGVNVCSHHGLDHQARVGSVGLPSPGMTLAVVDDDPKARAPGYSWRACCRSDALAIVLLHGVLACSDAQLLGRLVSHW